LNGGHGVSCWSSEEVQTSELTCSTLTQIHIFPGDVDSSLTALPVLPPFAERNAEDVQ
jgi:hypothetical protein